MKERERFLQEQEEKKLAKLQIQEEKKIKDIANLNKVT